MRKLLILWVLGLLALTGMVGMAGAQSNWYEQSSIHQFGSDLAVDGNLSSGLDANIGGDINIDGSINVAGSINAVGGLISRGVIGQDMQMGAGYDFTVASGDTAFDLSGGTGAFKTTAGDITLGGGTNAITLNGPVVGVDGLDWTMVGHSMLTLGTVGIMANGGTIYFLNGTSGTNGVFSGTVTAEQLTTTDDATINDDLMVLGKADITETLTAEQLTSTDDANIADALDVGGALTAGTMASDAGITAVTTVQAEQLTSTDDITATDDVNAHDLVVTADVGTATVTASGEVRAENLYSTDDAYIHDHLYTDGTTTAQAIVSNSSGIFTTQVKAEDLKSTDDAYIYDDFFVDGTASLDVLTVNTTADINGALTTRGITLDADSGIGMSGTATLSGVTGTFTGRVQAEDLKSTDDAYIKDDLFVDSTATLNDVVINTSLDVNGATTTQGIILDAGKNITMSGAAATLTGVTGIFSGTVTGEQLTSTDDAKITDALEVDGAAALNGTTIASGTSLTVTTADKLIVGGVIVPQRIPITMSLGEADVDHSIFIADGAYMITSIKEVHSHVGGTSAVVNIEKITGTNPPGSGTSCQQGTFNLTATVNTVQSATMSSTPADYTLASGDRLGVNVGGSIAETGLLGSITVYLKRV